MLKDKALERGYIRKLGRYDFKEVQEDREKRGRAYEERQRKVDINGDKKGEHSKEQNKDS